MEEEEAEEGAAADPKASPPNKPLGENVEVEEEEEEEEVAAAPLPK